MEAKNMKSIQGHENLYKLNGRYFKLFAKGITPNGCWLIQPLYREIIDISGPGGYDVYGLEQYKAETGTIPGHLEFLHY